MGRLATALGRFDWGPGVRAHLFAAFRKYAPNSTHIDTERMAFILKTGFGVGTVMNNQELHGLLQTFPRQVGLIPIDWFVDFMTSGDASAALHEAKAAERQPNTYTHGSPELHSDDFIPGPQKECHSHSASPAPSPAVPLSQPVDPSEPTVVYARNVLAHQLSFNDQQGNTAAGIARLIQTNLPPDVGVDGKLNRHEFADALVEAGVEATQMDMDTVFGSLDYHNEGRIPVVEFARVMHWHQQARSSASTDVRRIHAQIAGLFIPSKYNVHRQFFVMQDVNGDGRVSKREFRKALQNCHVRNEPWELDLLFDAFDPGRTGVVEIDTFFRSIYDC